MATTIPYDKGWKVTDNGKPVEILPNWNDCLLAFNLEGQGEHQVELTYMPVGLPAGICVSLISLAGLIALVFFMKKRQNHN